MNADSYGLKLNEQSSEQTVYDYNMLMSAMNVSVSKHLMDENFTVVWANDYFYSQTLYTKQEYEAIYHNSCRKYFEQYPEEYEKMAMAVEQALLKGKSGYECICRLPLQISELELGNFKFPDLKIIVVDDDVIVCEHTTELLRQIGIRSDWETCGQRAVQKVLAAHQAGEPYDAVILDCRMPDQDGVETAAIIRRAISEPLPIILISAYDSADVETKARQAGVNGFMTKPVFMSTLCRALQRYVLGQAAADEQKSKTDFSGKRFLLVEDNALNREIAMEMLESAGAVVESACDGAEGAAKFAAEPAGYYDLLLMDVQMPVMNGYEATQKIRASAKSDARTVPIVAMTADAFAEDIIEAKKAGMNSHLAKPLNLATLVREINKQLQKH